MGLMQLLPTLAKGWPRNCKSIISPRTNCWWPIPICNWHALFQTHVDHYDGQVEYALAAYNAGEDRGMTGASREISKTWKSLWIDPVYRDPRVRAGHHAHAMMYKLLIRRGRRFRVGVGKMP